jgi:short-subunit dehydrogenase
MDLKNRVVMVTGASSGIGEATARAMAARGARVVVVSEREADLNAVAVSINEAGGCAVPIVADFARAGGVDNLIERTEATVGPVEVLVNNAGVGMHALVGERPMEDTRFLFEVNFFALASLCSQVLTGMYHRRAGCIINVSSAAGQFGCAGMSAYSASKGAVHAFTQALRVEARMHDVFVSEIVPISVRTAFFNNVRGKAYKPLGVVITPEKVANCIVHTASAKRPLPEVWPYKPIRLAFLANVLAPGILMKINAHTFERSQRMHGETK